MLHRPESLGEAVGLLEQRCRRKPLAGGASLVAMLNARLVEPSALVSSGAIERTARQSRLADGTLRIGAMTRHREVAEHLGAGRSAATCCDKPRAAIANPTIRAMGTIGGSVALNDPGADYPPVLLALSATYGNRRSVRHAPCRRRRLFPRLVHDRAGAGRTGLRRSICRRVTGAAAFITSSLGWPAISRSSASRLRCRPAAGSAR